MKIRRAHRDLASAGFGLLALFALAFGRTATGHDAPVRANATPLRLAHFPNITHAPAIVGVAHGDFAENLPGYSLDVKVVNAGPEAMEALLANEIDVAYVGPSPAINTFVKSHGKALQIVAGACDGGASLIRRGDVEINSLRDLDGKRVGVPQLGGTQDVSCRLFLSRNGLLPKERGGTVEIIPAKNPDILALFKQRQLDAAWVPEPWASRLKQETGAKTVFDERDLWPSGRFTTTVIVVRKAFAEEHPDAVASLLRGHVASVRLIQDHPDDAKTLVNDELKRLTGKKLPKEVLNEAWNHVDFTIQPDRENIQAFAEAAYKAGYAKKRPTGLETLVDTTALTVAQKAAE